MNLCQFCEKADDGACRARVPRVLYVGQDLRIVDTERLRDMVDDPGIRLVGDKVIDIVKDVAVPFHYVLRFCRHEIAGVHEDVRPWGMVSPPFEGLRYTPATPFPMWPRPEVWTSMISMSSESICRRRGRHTRRRLPRDGPTPRRHRLCRRDCVPTQRQVPFRPFPSQSIPRRSRRRSRKMSRPR